MNTSKYIDTTKCASCGLCCKSMQIGYSKEYDKKMLLEVERFKVLDPKLVRVHETSKGFWVEFMIPCIHLKKNKKGYYCAIYDQKRPDICEKYPYKNTLDCPHKKALT